MTKTLKAIETFLSLLELFAFVIHRKDCLMTQIQPYEFNKIKHLIQQLIRTYQSVNDPKTVKTVETMTEEKIASFFSPEDSEALAIVKKFFDPGLKHSTSLPLLEELKQFVEPFDYPSTKQLEKLFRKVKKLKLPNTNKMDMRDFTYFAWDDAGTQSKFILVQQENKTLGFYGHVSTEIKKGICPLCLHEGNVSMFLSLTKSSGDGTYTKRGNYICRNSQDCNSRIEQRETLDDFVATLQMK